MEFDPGRTLYRAFGLTIRSDFPLPELPIERSEERNAADIILESRDLGSAWQEAGADAEESFAIREGLVLFRIRDVADFRIRSGSVVTVSPFAGADRDKLRLYVLGTCMGVLLMQRRVLPLHGSAVAIDGKAYAVVGDSGAGKSTLASALLHRGFRLLSDDVIAVKVEDGKEPLVMPAYPQQKLWQESLDRLKLEAVDKKPLFEREKKFAVSIADRFYPEPLPLAGVFELCKTEGGEIDIQPVRGLERLDMLYRHTYRNFALRQLGLLGWHFMTTTHLVQDIDTFRMSRPTARFTAHQLAAGLLNTVAAAVPQQIRS